MSCYLLFLLRRLTMLCRAWRKTNEVWRKAFGRDITPLMESTITRCRTAFRLGGVPVLCSAEIAGPLTMSALRRVILLPDHVFKTDSSEILVSILGHEMAHVRRRDFILNIVYELLYSPISFHPAAWLIKRRIDETREFACDEMVTEKLVSPSVYARSLVAVTASILSAGRLSYTLGIFEADNLEQRIKRLAQRRPQLGARLAKLSLVAAISVLIGAGAAASAFSLSASQDYAPTIAFAERYLVGTWRGRWEDILVPEFKSDTDSSPIWLEFKVENGKLVGVAFNDAIDLEDQPGTDVKIMRVYPKTSMEQLFDIKADGNTLYFKKRFGQGHILEHRLEILSEYEAKLSTKDTLRQPNSEEFQPWLTLTRSL
jgi:hypothetical protein